MRRKARWGLKLPGREDGYTLTEMLVVIGIIGLIAAALTPGIIGQLARAKSKAAQLQLDTLAADVEAFSSDVQRYPTQSEGLKALLQEPEGVDGWSGPYVRDLKMMNDPWGQPIGYDVDTDKRSFVLTSLGADAKPGGTGVNRDLHAPQHATSSATASPVPAPVKAPAGGTADTAVVQGQTQATTAP